MITETQNIKSAIESAQEKWLESKIKRSRWAHIRASGIDDVCTRRIFYYMTAGELAIEITTDLVAIFQEGISQEPAVRRFLSELGFEVKQAGFTEVWDSLNISGSVDGVMQYDGKKYVAEIKTCSEYSFDALNTADDFKSGYYRKWYGQLQLYMLMFEIERGLFILKNKNAMRIKIIEVALDYEYADGLLKKAEAVNCALKSGVEPAFLNGNPVECKRCAFFGTVCNPPLNFDGQTVNVEDGELEKMLVRRDELKPLSSEYDKVDKAVKERFKGIPMALCGNFAISGKESERKYKATEERTVKTWTTTIEKLA